jgi:ribosomal protein L37AE/L43A
VIFGLKRKEPSICAICAREASGFGYATQARKFEVMWTCEDCIGKYLKGVYKMSVKELNDVEKKAINAAFNKVSGAQLEAVLGALWAENVRDLNMLDAAMIDKVLERLAIEGGGIDAAKAFLLAYEAEMKLWVDGAKAPF